MAKKTTKTTAPKAEKKTTAPKAEKKTTAPKAKASKKPAAPADAEVPVVETGLIDVTTEVMAAVEKPKRKAKAAVVEETTPDVVGEAASIADRIAVAVEAKAQQDREERAAIAVYAYAERYGIDVAEVPRIAESCGELDALKAEAGMELTDVVVWLACQKAREFDTKYVRPYAPTTSRRDEAKAGGGKPSRKADGTVATARVQVFGHSATAVIRALRATCGMDFAQIRSVLDATGAGSVADGTIRAQMAGGGLTRGEPAPLTDKQIEEAKEACGLVTA